MYRQKARYLLLAALSLCFILPMSQALRAQDLVWAKRAGGTDFEYGFAIAADGSGNSYVTGGFGGSATFGAGETNETTLTSGVSADIFVAKYDASGDLVWAKRAGGTFIEQGGGIAVDGAGNSYVTGSGGIDIFVAKSDAISSLVRVKGGVGGGDIFMAKYDASGDLVWAKRACGCSSEFEVGIDIAVDGAGNSHVTGSFRDSATFGPGETNETILTSAGAEDIFAGDFDIFVAKYDASGDLVWAKRAGGTSLDGGIAIAVDGAGNSYVTGFFEDSATFGPGETNETTLTGTGPQDIFVAKHDASGDLVWAKRAGGTNDDRSRGIAVDGAGNSYVTGFFKDSATFGPGETNETTLTTAGSDDIFVAKYDASGDLVWAKRAGGTIPEVGNGIAVDGAGNSYVVPHTNVCTAWGLWVKAGSGRGCEFGLGSAAI